MMPRMFRLLVLLTLGCGSAYDGTIVSAANSTVSANPIVVVADGVSITNVTVTVRDIDANVLSDKEVTLTSSRGATDTIQPATATTDGLGVATFTVRSTTTGTAFLTAVADDIGIAQTVSVTFNPVEAPPAAPTNLIATPGNAQVMLTWDAASGAASYTVRRRDTGGYTDLATSIPTTAYTDGSAVNETTYYYVVRAVNPFGTSPDSNEVMAKPSPPLFQRVDSNTFRTFSNFNTSGGIVPAVSCTTANASCHAVDGNDTDTAHAWSGTGAGPYLQVDSNDGAWGKNVYRFTVVYEASACSGNFTLFYQANGTTAWVAVPGSFPCVAGAKTTLDIPLNLPAWAFSIGLPNSTTFTVYEVQFWTTN